MVVRPPKVLTELVNTPIDRHDALGPEAYAAALAERLLDPSAAEDVVVELAVSTTPVA